MYMNLKSNRGIKPTRSIAGKKSLFSMGLTGLELTPEDESSVLDELETPNAAAPIPVPLGGESEKYNKEVVVTRKNIYRFYLSDLIHNDESWYLPLLKRLNDENNDPNDEIVLYLNNYGGSVHALVQLYAAIDRCKCPVKLYVEGVCASAAAYLTMGGRFDYIEIHPLTDVLIHTARFFSFGKLSDMSDTVNFQSRQAERLIRLTCKDVLTTEEIEDVLRGKEFYMSGDEFSARLLEREKKYLARQAKKEEAKRKAALKRAEVKAQEKSKTTNPTKVKKVKKDKPAVEAKS